MRPAHPAPEHGRRQAGLTITELLVTIALFAVLGTVAFGIYNSTVKLVSADTSRVYVQQNVRTSLDIISQDLREAGENLPTSYLVSGVEFNPTSQTLLVRRGLTIGALYVCQTVSGAVSTVQVLGTPPDASTSTSPAACSTYSDANGNGISDQLDPWVTYRQTTSSSIPAILYNPDDYTATRVLVTGINAGNSSGVSTVSVTNFSTTANTFSYTRGSVLIPVDERQYSVVNGELQLTVNGNTASVQSMAYGIQSLNLLAYFTTSTNGATTTTTSNSLVTSSPWRTVSRMDVTLAGNNTLGLNRATSRSFTTTIYPRNVIQTR